MTQPQGSVTPNADRDFVMIKLPKAIMNEGHTMVFVAEGEPFVVNENVNEVAAGIREEWGRLDERQQITSDMLADEERKAGEDGR